MYITVEKFFKLFKYLYKYGYGKPSFNTAHYSSICNILEINKDLFSKIDKLAEFYIKEYNYQTEENSKLNTRFNSFIDPEKFDLLKSNDVRSEVYEEKFKFSIFPETDNAYEKAKNDILCLITDLKILNLSGLEKQFDIIDCNLAIIKVKKDQLFKNQRDYETRSILDTNARSARG